MWSLQEELGSELSVFQHEPLNEATREAIRKTVEGYLLTKGLTDCVISINFYGESISVEFTREITFPPDKQQCGICGHPANEVGPLSTNAEHESICDECIEKGAN